MDAFLAMYIVLSNSPSLTLTLSSLLPHMACLEAASQMRDLYKKGQERGEKIAALEKKSRETLLCLIEHLSTCTCSRTWCVVGLNSTQGSLFFVEKH